jgi:Bacterioferritin (cytochrome b1)
MAKQDSTSPSRGSSGPVTREQLLEGLQQDLAREYKAIIQYVIFSQKLDTARFQNIAGELEKHAHEELDHALAIARQIDYYGGISDAHARRGRGVRGQRVDAVADLRAEDDTINNYRSASDRRRSWVSSPSRRCCRSSLSRSRTTRSISHPRSASCRTRSSANARDRRRRRRNRLRGEGRGHRGAGLPLDSRR